MKRFTLTLFMALCLISCDSADDNSFEGVWESINSTVHFVVLTQDTYAEYGRVGNEASNCFSKIVAEIVGVDGDVYTLGTRTMRLPDGATEQVVGETELRFSLAGDVLTITSLEDGFEYRVRRSNQREEDFVPLCFF